MLTSSTAAASQPVADGSVSSARRALTLPLAASLAALLSVLGVFAVLSTANYLWALWTTDPLKSIGGFVPLISLILILRVWRSLGWEFSTSNAAWWAFVFLAFIIALVHIRDHAILEFVLTPSWTIFVPPHSFVALCYAVSLVLFFGGVRLLRAALFPVLLMAAVNPVPHIFNVWVDLPLQHVSALVARGFAHALGQPLTHDQLRLMFTPDLGMFIAPGCNGIRGAVTMGFIALIAGYIYRFRPSIHALFVACAVLLGYLFNFARLCLLVVYYIVAVHIPQLRNHSMMGDYIIGASLFFIATILLFTVIRRVNPTHDFVPPPLPQPDTRNIPAPRSFAPRALALVLLLALGSVTYIRAIVQQHNAPHTAADPNALGVFPQQIGSFKLQRRWNEYLSRGGPLLFYWADYRRSLGGPVVTVGVSPVLGAHDTLICHAARGEDWLWHGNLVFATAAGPTSLSGTLYNNGVSQYLEATTVCTGITCGQFTTNNKHFGLVYSRPDAHTLLSQSPTRPIPVLLRAEIVDTQMSADSARAILTENIGNFLSAAQLSAFGQPYRQP